MKSQAQWIIEVSDDIKDILLKKDSDYNNSFSKSFKKYGILTALIRLEDKFNRLENLVNGAEQKVKDESIIDTLKDIAGYCQLTIIELLKRMESKENE